MCGVFFNHTMMLQAYKIKQICAHGFENENLHSNILCSLTLVYYKENHATGSHFLSRK